MQFLYLYSAGGERYISNPEIEEDIHRMIERVVSQTAPIQDGATPTLSPGVPYDPNLSCPYCPKRYQVGMIQYHRRHAATHHKERSPGTVQSPYPDQEVKRLATGQPPTGVTAGKNGSEVLVHLLATGQDSQLMSDSHEGAGSADSEEQPPATGQEHSRPEQLNSEQASSKLTGPNSHSWRVATGVADSPDTKELFASLKFADYTVAVDSEYIDHVQQCFIQQRGSCTHTN